MKRERDREQENKKNEQKVIDSCLIRQLENNIENIIIRMENRDDRCLVVMKISGSLAFFSLSHLFTFKFCTHLVLDSNMLYINIGDVFVCTRKRERNKREGDREIGGIK